MKRIIPTLLITHNPITKECAKLDTFIGMEPPPPINKVFPWLWTTGSRRRATTVFVNNSYWGISVARKRATKAGEEEASKLAKVKMGWAEIKYN